MGLTLQPESLDGVLREIHRRLRDLETSNTASRTSISTEHDPEAAFRILGVGRAELIRLDRNGLTVTDPSDGLPRLVSGIFTDGVTSFTGVVLYDGDGRSVLMTRNDKAGLVKPDIPAPFVKANDFTAVTSANFVTVAQWNPRRLYHDVLRVAFPIGSDAGTVGQVRLRETTGGAVTTTLTTTAGAAQTAVFEWLHGRQVGDDPGDNVNFVVEAKRVSGAGNINVYTPNENACTSSALVPAADVNGNAQFA